jgi:hypothetical protein
MTTENKEPVSEEVVDAKYEALNQFVNAVIKKDEAAMASSISSYITAKSRDILGTSAPAVVKEDAEPVDGEEDGEEEGDDVALSNRDKRKAPLAKAKPGKMQEAVKVDEAKTCVDDGGAAEAGVKVNKGNRLKAKKGLKKMKPQMEAVAQKKKV